MYCKCKPGVKIPQLRLDLGYKTCVDCSTNKQTDKKQTKKQTHK